MELILQYFPTLSDVQLAQLTALESLYRDWNDKINVISRKDIEHLYEHHVLHSLAIARLDLLTTGDHVLDVGTGGGFPGIPLAIMYPAVSFTLLDSTAKKIHVVQEIATSLGLKNVEAVHARMEAHQGSYDYIVSRAVSTLTQLVAWTKHIPPSKEWIALKGGSVAEIRKELLPVYAMQFISIEDMFARPYFSEKYVIRVSRK